MRANVLPLNVYQYEAMKKTILAKLKSDSGASLMAALLFFVMAATVGSIILAAATASSGRLANLKKSEQGYYAMSSAADVLLDRIQDKDCKVVIRLVQEDNTIPDASKLSSAYLDPRDSTTVINASDYILAGVVNGLYPLDSNLKYSSVFPNYLQADIDAFSESTKKETVITITPDNSTPDNSLSVNAVYMMDKALNLMIEITPSVSGTGNGDEKITMKFKPVISEENTITYHDMVDTENQRNALHVKTYTIHWVDPVID